MACEYSGVVRDAFTRAGHEAWSCDILPSKSRGHHIQGDALDHILDGWDMLLAFPPCTYLSRAAARLWKDPSRRTDQILAGTFALALWSAPIDKICIENPPGRLPEFIGRFHQTIQPWHFGEPYTKLTCLWLQGLPPLLDTYHSRGRTSWTLHNQGNSKQRPLRRSRTFDGIANAMAAQWG